MRISPRRDKRCLTAKDMGGVPLPVIPDNPERKSVLKKHAEDRMPASIMLISALIQFAIMGGFLSVAPPDHDFRQGKIRDPKYAPSLSETMAKISEDDTHNEAVLAQLRLEINQFFDSLINMYMDPNHEDYVGKDSAYVLPPVEAFATIDGYRRVIEYVEARKKIGGKIDEEELPILQAERETQIVETHDERIEMIVEDTNFTWACNPEEDMYNVQFGLYGGTRANQYQDRYFHPAHGEPEAFPRITPYKSIHRFLPDQHRDGMVNCTSARMTPWVFEAAYAEHCPDAADDIMSNIGAMIWSDHVFSSYQEPDEELHTIRDAHVTKPFVKGVQPAGAKNPGVEHDLVAHLALYMLDSGLATGAQISRMHELGILKPTEGEYLEGEPPTYATPLLVYNDALDEGSWQASEEPEIEVDAMERLRTITTQDVLNAYMSDHFWIIIQGSYMEPVKSKPQMQLVSWDHPILKSLDVIFEDGEWNLFIGEYRSEIFLQGVRLHALFNPEIEEGYESYLDHADRTGAAIQKISLEGDINLLVWINMIRNFGLGKAALKKASEDPNFLSVWLSGYHPIVNYSPDENTPGGAMTTGKVRLMAQYADYSEFLAEYTGDERYLQHVDEARAIVRKVPRAIVGDYTLGEIKGMSQEEIYALCDSDDFSHEAYGGGQVEVSADIEGHVLFAHRLSEDPARFVTMLNGEVFQHWEAFIFFAPAIEKAMANDDGAVGLEPYKEWYEKVKLKDLSHKGPLRQNLDLTFFGPPLTWYATLDTPTLPHVQAFVRGLLDEHSQHNFPVFSNLVGVYLGFPRYKEGEQEFTLETSDDFDALMKDPFEGMPTDIQGSDLIPHRSINFDVGPNPMLYFKLKKIYIQETDQERRIKMLGKLALLQNRHLCIKKEDLYAEDLAYIKSIPTQGLWIIAHETMDMRALGRRLKVLYDDEAISTDILAGYSGLTPDNIDYAERVLKVIAELNPELWLRLHEEINASNY